MLKRRLENDMQQNGEKAFYSEKKMYLEEVTFFFDKQLIKRFENEAISIFRTVFREKRFLYYYYYYCYYFISIELLVRIMIVRLIEINWKKKEVVIFKDGNGIEHFWEQKSF